MSDRGRKLGRKIRSAAATGGFVVSRSRRAGSLCWAGEPGTQRCDEERVGACVCAIRDG